MVQFRSGWLPHNLDSPTPQLTGHLLYGSVYQGEPPAGVDFYSKVHDWGMLLNDQWGDCTCAADGHIVMQQSLYGGKLTVVTDAQALAAYEAIGKFNPNAGLPGQNATDRGATIQQALEYLRTQGMNGFKIKAYGQVQPESHLAVKRAIDEFGALSIGMNLPSTADQQFEAGAPFDVAAGSTDEGGHCMAVFGYDANYLYVVTWGKICRMTWAFWDHYVTESWAVISEAWDVVSGMELEAFGAEFAAETGTPNPFAPAPATHLSFFGWLINLIKKAE